MSDSTTETVNDTLRGPMVVIIRSIGYISLCFSLFLFLTLKIMKYILSRKNLIGKLQIQQQQHQIQLLQC